MKNLLTSGIQSLRKLLRKIKRPLAGLAAGAALWLLLALTPASAQVVDATFTNLATQATFQYQAPGTTNLVTITNGFPTNTSSATGNVYLLPGTNVTVSTGMVNTLSSNAVIDIRHFDEVSMEFSFQLYNPSGGVTTADGTNVYVFGGSDDGVHFSDTNQPLFSISVHPTVGQSNACVVTNVPRTLLGSTGFLQLQQIQTLNTNAETNHTITIWGKSQRSGILTPVF